MWVRNGADRVPHHAKSNSNQPSPASAEIASHYQHRRLCMEMYPWRCSYAFVESLRPCSASIGCFQLLGRGMRTLNSTGRLSFDFHEPKGYERFAISPTWQEPARTCFNRSLQLIFSNNDERTLGSVYMHCFSHCTTFAFVICLLIERYHHFIVTLAPSTRSVSCYCCRVLRRRSSSKCWDHCVVLIAW